MNTILICFVLFQIFRFATWIYFEQTIIKKKHQLKHWPNLNQIWVRKKGGISNLELQS